MIKRSFLFIAASAIALFPMLSSAHPGHGLDDRHHSLLHGEHVFLLGAIVVVAYLIREIIRSDK